MELIILCSDVILSLPPAMLVVVVLGRDSGDGQYQDLSVTSSGQRVCSYKGIQSSWLTLLGLECVWEGPTCAPKPASNSTDPGSRSAKGPRHSEIHFHLLVRLPIRLSY